MSIWSRGEKHFIFREYSLASFNPSFFFFFFFNENSLARLLHWVSSFSRLVFFFSFFLSASGLAISPFPLFHGFFMFYYKVQLFFFCAGEIIFFLIFVVISID